MAPRTPSRSRSRRQSPGFTLVELVVALVVIGILAAILTPLLGDMIDDARATRAARDTQEIASAVLTFRRDTGKWPIFVSGTGVTTSSSIYDVLAGPGTDPSPPGSAWLTGARGEIDAVLSRNVPEYTTSGRFRWRGPYLAQLNADPWSNAYLVNGNSLRFGANEAGFVLSAGPNGTIETPFVQAAGSGSAAISLGGDDIGARIR